MPNSYSLNERERRVCRWLSYAFGAAGLSLAIYVAVSAISPHLSAMRIDCGRGGCAIAGNPQALLPDTVDVSTTAAVLDRYLELPTVRLKLVVAQLVINAPVVGLLLSVAAAMAMLGRRRGQELARALLWLRRGAIFALVSVLLAPLGETLLATTVVQAFRPSTRFVMSMDIAHFSIKLLLALAAFVVTWALAAGLRATRDLAEIV